MNKTFLFLTATVIGLASASAARAQTPVTVTDSESDYSDEEPDYWADINFTSADFAQVRNIVAGHYIDPNYDKKLAWATAADYVLYSMSPAQTILPERYFQTQETFRGANFIKISPDDGFVITLNPPPGEHSPGTLTDDQIRQEKEKYRTGIETREREWARVNFTEADFSRVFQWAIDQERSKPGYRESKFWVAATTGYLASLDPHTTIVSARAWEDNTRETEDGSFEGIGAMLTTTQGKIFIESPIEGQPAEQAGVKAGDQIVAVDGRRVDGMELSKVVKLIKGEKGTTVVLTIRRAGTPADIEFSIVRRHIEVRNVQSRLLRDHPDMGYVKITGFIEGTAARVDEAIRELVRTSRGGRLRGLVMDLRMNSGGLLNESVDIADAFLETGNIVSVRSPSSRDESYGARAGSWDFPVVVLVNSGSASASEILASAIQDNGRGLVIGDRTFGKASVQTLVPAYPRTDYLVKVTIARYYSPSGRTIQVTGVIPDVDTPPEVGGRQPIGFREEDLSHHLTLIQNDYRSPNESRLKALSQCTVRMGTALPLGRARQHSGVRQDFQLQTAGDYLECMWLNQGHNTRLTGGAARH